MRGTGTGRVPGTRSVPFDGTGTPLRANLLATALVCAAGCVWYYLFIDGLVTRPARGQHYSPPVVAEGLAAATGARWRQVSAIAHDGIYLEAWTFTPSIANGHAVIVAHEAGGSRLSLLHFAKWLLRAGYVCLVPDGRAHGVSGGSVMTYGIQERHDIVSWAKKIRAECPSIRHIVGLGVSLGGTVLLQGAAAGADVSGIVADSVGADLSMPYKHVADHSGLTERWAQTLFAPVVKPLFVNARLRYGIDLSAAAPIRAVRSLSIPVLLIHGTEDGLIPVSHARRLHAANPNYTVLWEVSGAAHTRTDEVMGAEYQRRVLGFFSKVTATQE